MQDFARWGGCNVREPLVTSGSPSGRLQDPENIALEIPVLNALKTNPLVYFVTDRDLRLFEYETLRHSTNYCHYYRESFLYLVILIYSPEYECYFGVYSITPNF